MACNYEAQFINTSAPLATEEADEFEDAMDSFEGVSETKMDLATSLNQAEIAMKMFLNNKIEDARAMMLPWTTVSMYHALGAAVFEFVPSMLTFDRRQVAIANSRLRECIALCDKHRRSYTIGESVGNLLRKHPMNYTDTEAHAELCYAECLLLMSGLTLLEDEELTSLIRASYKVKNCYSAYRECARILERKMTWDSIVSKQHFESGVLMGSGLFKVLLAMLPNQIATVLEIMGFNRNKEMGYQELIAGSRSPGLRHQLCKIILLGFNLVVCQFTSQPIDLDITQEILNEQLQIFPSSVWYVIFDSRLHFIKGKYETALDGYRRAKSAQDVWVQLHHLCYWDIMWINALRLDWRAALEHTNTLIKESHWSRTIYMYVRAAFIMQLVEAGVATPTEESDCEQLMRNLQSFKQRFAGKSIPMEKFVIKRAARYKVQGKYLLLPALEFLCLNNYFETLNGNWLASNALLAVLEKTRSRLLNEEICGSGSFKEDNKALVNYLTGTLLRVMGHYNLALKYLHQVVEARTSLKEDTFLVPYSLVEISVCFGQLGDYDKAINVLEDARKKSCKYALQTRLDVRIQCRLLAFKRRRKLLVEGSPPEPEPDSYYCSMGAPTQPMRPTQCDTFNCNPTTHAPNI